MFGRGLERFKKAQSVEPFSVTTNSSLPSTNQSATKSVDQSIGHLQFREVPLQAQPNIKQKIPAPEAAPLLGHIQPVTQVGGGQSTWQPPDWAAEPRTGLYYLEVLKEGEVFDRINLDKRRHIFGRLSHACDFVLDHQSVSRQHAAVVPHKNGSIYVIDLGSAHGTFVANERLTKDTPVELEVGQSLRFAASTRTYVLRKKDPALFAHQLSSVDIPIPLPPDPSDEDAIVSYNTLLNRYCLGKPDCEPYNSRSDTADPSVRATKRSRKSRVAFKDQVGGVLAEVVGVSDGAHVETEAGPVGVKEGSLVGRYESLVQSVVIPKGNEQTSAAKQDVLQKGVTNKLQEVFSKVKSYGKGNLLDEIYGEPLANNIGSSWAHLAPVASSSTLFQKSDARPDTRSFGSYIDEDDDLFGD